jgi:hypothetical protein
MQTEISRQGFNGIATRAKFSTGKCGIMPATHHGGEMGGARSPLPVASMENRAFEGHSANGTPCRSFTDFSRIRSRQAQIF